MYTPRKFVRHPDSPLFYVIESDNNILPSSIRHKLLAEVNGMNGDSPELSPEEFGYPRGQGHWASCIQVVDPQGSKSVLETIEFEDNECAISVATGSMASQDDENFLFIGTAKDLVTAPRSVSHGHVYVYRFHDQGRSLEFIHRTKTDTPPQALLGFQGRLLVGTGRDLRIYDLGMKQLLRKSQTLDVVPNLIVGLQTQGSRIIVSDVRESVTYVVYKYLENKLIPFADDTVARWTTAATMVDYETTAGGDKFGNLWLVRCPTKASESADEEGAGTHLVHERQYLGGAPNRLDPQLHFFAHDVPTALQKTPLVSGGRDVLFWAGLQGTLGALVPFAAREDVDFFQALEQQLRAEAPPLAGRDHLVYRSYYVPVKGVIDGDFCERFLVLGRDVREKIAAELERSVREVERKISVSFSMSLSLGIRGPFCLWNGSGIVLTRFAGHADEDGVLSGQWQTLETCGMVRR